MTNPTTGSGKRIAKNTLLLYLRSIIIMILSIYSSRVLLKTLGVDDFGLYGVVGGVVAMFSSLKSVLAAAVQRFVNFEKGKGNNQQVQKIFNMSILVHLAIALLFALIVESFGCWYICNHLIVPHNNIDTALFVFHCSVIASMITIYTIPYDAVVIANERMDFYAIQSITDVTLRLAIIFLLPILPFSFIRSYAVLILVVAILIRIMSVIYTNRFPECKKLKYWNKETFKELISFAGWNFFGCIAYSLIEEGTNLILNLFGGVVANAARGLTYQIRSAIMTLSNNVLVASQPFITQRAANVDIATFWTYIFIQSRVMFYIMMLTGLPIYIYAEQILRLWLDTIPEYTVEFVRAIVIYTIVMSFQKSLDLSFKAYNKMATYQIVDACCLLLTIPSVYVALKLGAPLYYAFLLFSVIRLIDYIAVLFVAKYKNNLLISEYFYNVVIPSIIGFVIFFLVDFLFGHISKSENFIILLVYMMMSIIIAFVLLYLLSFRSNEKEMIYRVLLLLKSKIK